MKKGLQKRGLIWGMWSERMSRSLPGKEEKPKVHRQRFKNKKAVWLCVGVGEERVSGPDDEGHCLPN